MELVECNFNDREECSRALIDAYGIFAVTSRWELSEEKEWQQAENIIEAAKERNVQHFITRGLPETIIHSESPVDRSKISVLQNYLRQFPLERRFPFLTYLHSGFYYQNFITFFVPDSPQLTFRYPSLKSSTRLSIFDLNEIGSIVQQCFLHPRRWGEGQTLSIVAERLTMDEICNRIEQVTKRDVDFVPLTVEEAREKLHREMVDDLPWYENNPLDDEQMKEICPKMKTFLEWLEENQWMIE